MTAIAPDLFKVYEGHSKTLRTWLVAYGIGAPVLFFTDERLTKGLLSSGQARTVASYCLIGVILQVALAMINKNAMWACYYAEEKPSLKSRTPFRLADWVSRQYWIDLLFDLSTVFLFAIATWKAFNIVVTS